MITITNEGDVQFSDSGNSLIDFFSKAGSIYDNDIAKFYENNESALDLFKKAWTSDPYVAFKLMLWVRDCRGGAGNRSGFRSILNWMANNNSEWVELNMHWIPMIGRWDDLRSLYNTPLEKSAGIFWWNAIFKDANILAAKWCDRNDYPVRKASGMKISQFRRFLANIRKDSIVEYKMCNKEWNKIEYDKIPSIAMARYASAFMRNDRDGFIKFKKDVKTGVKKVKSDVLFPHDCVRTAKYGDVEMAEMQFNELPNYAPDDTMSIVIADTSGSMMCRISGSVKAIDVSMGLALYFSGRIDKDNVFYKRFIKFCDEGHLVDWRGQTFIEAIRNPLIFDNAVGTTRIDKALDTILNIALNKNIEQRLMPKNLIIVSDMQFTYGSNSDESSIELSLRKWDKAGYNRPNIIYWDVVGYK